MISIFKSLFGQIFFYTFWPRFKWEEVLFFLFSSLLFFFFYITIFRITLITLAILQLSKLRNILAKKFYESWKSLLLATFILISNKTLHSFSWSRHLPSFFLLICFVFNSYFILCIGVYIDVILRTDYQKVNFKAIIYAINSQS